MRKRSRRDVTDPDHAHDREIGDVDEDRRVDGAGREASQHVDPPVERRQLDEGLEPGRIDRDREERRAEQEERQRDDRHEVEVLPLLHERRDRGAHRRGREADEDRARQREDRPGREDEAEQQHDDEERPGVERTPEERPGHLAAATSGGPSGVERIGVVRLGVAQLEEEVERGLVEGPVHRRGRHQARRDEGRVRDVADVPDERAQAEADPSR